MNHFKSLAILGIVLGIGLGLFALLAAFLTVGWVDIQAWQIGVVAGVIGVLILRNRSIVRNR